MGEVAEDHDNKTDAEAWLPPRFSGAIAPKALTVSQLEAEVERLKSEARDEGFEAGKREGLAKSSEILSEEKAALNAMIQALQNPIASLDDELLNLSVAIAKKLAVQIIQRELREDSEQWLVMLHSALAEIPETESKLTIRLHPDDEARLKSHVEQFQNISGYCEIHSDQHLPIGSFVIEGQHSLIDADIESRIAEAFDTFSFGEGQDARSAT